jgi:hypothetical protein
LLVSGEDYAYASPARVRLKERRIELLAGEPRQRGRQLAATPSGQQERERELALAAERAYERLVRDRQASGSKRKGASAAVGRASTGSIKDPAARQTHKPLASAL